MSTAGSPITAGPLKWSDIVLSSFPVSEFLLDDAIQRIQTGHEQVFPALHDDERRKIEGERPLGARSGHLRTFAARAGDRVLLGWIESDELAALHPFFLHELKLPLNIGVDENVDDAAIDTVVLKRAIGEMGAVLDSAPEQPVASHCGRTFQRRCPRVAATQVRTERASQALVIIC